jgi:hypothetical protein
MKNPILLIGWTDNTGMEATGRHVWRDGVSVPEMTWTKKAHACVWSRDPADFDAGKAYTEKEGRQWAIMEDTDGVLNRYRERLLTQDRS